MPSPLVMPLVSHDEKNAQDIFAFLNTHLTPCLLTEDKTLRILCIGQLYQREYLFLWLWTLLTNDATLRISITNTSHWRMRDVLKEPNYIVDFIASEDFGEHAGRVTIHTVKDIDLDFHINDKGQQLDAEAMELLNQGFGLTLCCYQLHNCINWRFSLVNILQYLQHGGAFLFVETGSDFALLDGNFKSIDEISSVQTTNHGGKKTSSHRNLKELLLKYEALRNQHYHLWKPEISLSNYRELRNQIEHFFETVIDDEYRDANGQPGHNGTINNIKVRPIKLSEFVKDRIFSYFRTGLPESNSPDNVLIEGKHYNMSEKEFSDTLHEEYHFNRVEQLYLAKGFNKGKWLNIRERQWNYTPLIKDLEQIRDNRIETLGRKAMDLLVSHDVLLADYTWYVAIISWESEIDERWGYPIHLAYNDRFLRRLHLGKQPYRDDESMPSSSRIISGFWRLFMLEKMTGFSLLKLLFKQLNHKFPLFIERRNDSDLHGYTDGNTTIHHLKNKPEAWLAIQPEYDRKGKLQQLTIAVSNSLVTGNKINEKIQRDQLEIKNYEEIIKVAAGDYSGSNKPSEHSQTGENNWNRFVKKINVRDNLLVRAEINNGVEALVNQYMDNHKIPFADDIVGSVPYINIELSPEMRDDISRHMQLDFINPLTEDKYKSISDYIPDLMLSIALDFQLQQPGFRLGFFPSAIIGEKVRMLYDLPVESVSGLGGTLLFERLPHESTPAAIRQLIAARDKALSDATNLIFYKASIASYVNRDFQKQSMLAAVASISARSGAHTLGSHVLPEVVAKLLTSRVLEWPENMLYKQGRMKRMFEELHVLITSDPANQEAHDYLNHIQNQFVFLESEVRNFSPKLHTHINVQALIRYLQHRMDFITQIIGDLPNWTSPTWMVRDLMSRFYRQYHLLDAIADTEKITAYDYYDGIDDVKEHNWFGADEPWRDMQSGHQYWIYGSVYAVYNQNKRALLVVQHNTTVKDFDATGNTWTLIPDSLSFICTIESDEAVECWNNMRYGMEKYGYKGQRVKIKGFVTDVNVAKKCIQIDQTTFEQGRLLLKIRRRTYLSKSEGDQFYAMRSSSQYLHLEDTIDLGHESSPKKVREKILRAPLTKHRVFGIVEKIEEVSPFGNTTFLLYKKKDFWVTLSKSQLDALVHPQTHEIMHLQIGTRIIISGQILETEPGRFELMFPEIVEVSSIEYLISSSRDPKDQSHESWSDIQAAFPGGIVGQHAFFAILENVIRNAAKHNWVFLPAFYKAGKNLEVKIEFDDQDGCDFFICKVWTNTSDLRYQDAIPYGKRLNGASEYPHFNNETISKKLNTFLKAAIIKEKGELNKEHLGLSEIKICAALLAREDWTKDGHLHGEEVLLNDKLPKNEIKGYIRASMILEEETGKLVPRLGFRFKILKPKEIVVVTNTYLCADSNLGCRNNIRKCGKGACTIPPFVNANMGIDWLKPEDAALLSDEGKLDYEICLLYEDEALAPNSEYFATNIVRLINQTLSVQSQQPPAAFTKGGSMYQLRNKLSMDIEKFPYRLFVVTNWKSSESKALWQPFIEYNSHHSELELWKRDFLRFFRLRILFITPQDLEGFLLPMYSTPADQKTVDAFKLQIYAVWLNIFESSKHNYRLVVNSEAESTDIKDYREKTIPTVPPRLNMYSETANSLEINKLRKQTNGLMRDFESCESNDLYVNDSTLLILYGRHKEGKVNNQIYSEYLTGKKISFSLFKNAPKPNEYEYEKLLLQLHENALNTVMILDERVFQFVEEGNRREQFQNVNLIVPTEIRIKPDYLLKSKAQEMHAFGENNKNFGYPRTLSISDDQARISFFQPNFTLPLTDKNKKTPTSPTESNRYRITLLLAHQTLLEQIANALYSGRGWNMSQCLDELILQLKHDLRIPSIVITSGRGRSAHTSKHAKYMPFSNIANLVMRDYPDRMELSQILFKTLNYR